MSTYADFIARKRKNFAGNSLPSFNVPVQMFDWQAAVARWAMKKGRAALWQDCGTGKSIEQLAWANNVPGRVLIFAPLCVAEQTVLEGKKFGIDVVYATSQPMAGGARIVISNYERLDGFHPEDFAGVVLDESSILKSFDGKTRSRLIAAFKHTPYRLCCTATPSPNDIAELANHAEFLGLCTRAEFLATWFVHDDQGWRLKGHAKQPFYRWLASWAVALRTPSDIGYSDEGFTLPPLSIIDHVVEGGDPGGVLFPELGLKGIVGRQKARRASTKDRCAAVASLVLNSVYDESGILQEVARGQRCVGEGIQGRSKKQSAAAGVGETKIQDEQNFQGEGHSASQGLQFVAPEGEEGRAAKGLRADAEPIRVDVVGAREPLRNLPNDIQESENIPVRGSLPQNREDSCSPVYQLQSRNREIQGQPGIDASGGGLHRKPSWIIWCGLNEEQELMEKLLGSDCVSIHGKTSYPEKIRLLNMWISGEKPYMLSKMRVLGFGMNFQHCHNMAFVGIGDSYEQYYQAIRRCWRFGQKHPVNAHIVISNSERAVVSNVRRKQAESHEMTSQIIAHMRDFEREELAS